MCNAAWLEPQHEGLTFPPCAADRLAAVCVPGEAGGVLTRSGTVEVVSSHERDGSEVRGNLRWGVFVIVSAPDERVAEWFRAYGLVTDDTGRFAALYRPSHLVGLETTVSVLSAGLLGEPTGAPNGFRADVVAVAKRDLPAGEELDGEGGYCVYGALVPAAGSLAAGLVPVALAHGVRLAQPVARGAAIRRSDLETEPTGAAARLRGELVDRMGRG
jgi:predicted homoserine dehydrogenase-like protein